MPKPRHRSKKKPIERNENERELRELLLFLEQAPGFRLGLVYYDTPRTRQVWLDRVTEAAAARPIHLTVLDLTPTPKEILLLGRVREHYRDHPAPEGKRPAIMVVGLETTLEYRKLGPEAEQGMAMLHNANFHRELFPEAAPCPVVLWLNPSASTKFAQEAPDLWHWRSVTFSFSGPPEERESVEREQVRMLVVRSDSLPTPRKRERIGLLHDLLIELENSDECDTPGAKARRAALLIELGLAYHGLGQAGRALEDHERALTLYSEIGDRRGQGITLGNLGSAYADLGQVEKAIDHFEQQLAIMREIGDRRGEGNALGNLGTAYAYLGQVNKAIGYFEQQLAIARAVGDRRAEGGSLGNLASAFDVRGQAERAIRYFEEALVIAREIEDRQLEGIVLGNLGLAYVREGEAERAISHCEQAIVRAREIGDRRVEGNVRGYLGLAHATLGQSEKAIGLLREALAIGEEIDDPRIIQFVSKELKHLQSL